MRRTPLARCASCGAPTVRDACPACERDNADDALGHHAWIAGVVLAIAVTLFALVVHAWLRGAS